MQQYTIYLYLQNVLHVSGGISTDYQGLISLYLQYLSLGWGQVTYACECGNESSGSVKCGEFLD